jgi:cytidylate kinase
MNRRTVALPLGAHVLTITATVGSGGEQVAELVAERLRLPVLDAVIVQRVAARLDLSIEEAIALDGHAPSRLLAALACSGLLGPSQEGLEAMTYVQARAMFQIEVERVVRCAAADGGVIVRRAAALVLSDHALALHVRLDASLAARIDNLMAVRGLDVAAAERALGRSDRDAATYARRVHRATIDDPRHYDVVLDPLALGVAHCAEAITDAAHRRWSLVAAPIVAPI